MRSWIENRLKSLQAVILTLFFANVIFANVTLANTPQARFATLDWTVAETLIALGEAPKAMGEVSSYQRWVAEPKPPRNILDLGIRLQPNPEQLLRLAKAEPQPLIFINSGFYAQVTPSLQKFAKRVEIVDFYQAGNAWQNLLQATEKVANLIGKPHAYTQLMANYWQKIHEIRPVIVQHTARPVALVQFIDARHLRIYAENSPFGAVLNQLGFRNAWQGSANLWGFETIELTQLMKLPKNSRFVVVKPYPSNIKNALAYNSIWQHLPLAKDPLVLPAVWTFGGVPSAQRFAEILAKGLTQGGEQW